MDPSDNTTPTGRQAVPLIVINLGRTKTTASIVASDGSTTPILVNGSDGIAARYTDPATGRSTVRLTDKLISLVDADQLDEATELTSSLAARLLADIEPETPAVLSLPASFGPLCEAVATRGFGRHCTIISALRHPLSLLGASANLGDEPVLGFENDGGELSIIAFDGASRLAYPPAPLSIGPDDDETDVVRRLRSYTRDVSAYLPTSEIVVDDAWASVAARFRTIVLGGHGASHPRFRSLLERQFPHRPLIVTESTRPADAIVELGPLHSTWAAGWPTAKPAIADGVLSLLGSNGAPCTLRIGSQVTTGLKLPADLVDNVRVRPLPDGRLLLLGAKGIRPLNLHVRWPLTGGEPTEISVSPIGVRPLELIAPRDARPHQATAS